MCIHMVVDLQQSNKNRCRTLLNECHKRYNRYFRGNTSCYGIQPNWWGNPSLIFFYVFCWAWQLFIDFRLQNVSVLSVFKNSEVCGLNCSGSIIRWSGSVVWIKKFVKLTKNADFNLWCKRFHISFDFFKEKVMNSWNYWFVLHIFDEVQTKKSTCLSLINKIK